MWYIWTYETLFPPQNNKKKVVKFISDNYDFSPLHFWEEKKSMNYYMAKKKKKELWHVHSEFFGKKSWVMDLWDKGTET